MVGGREEEEGKYVVSSLALARVLLLDRQLYLSLFIFPYYNNKKFYRILE